MTHFKFYENNIANSIYIIEKLKSTKVLNNYFVYIMIPLILNQKLSQRKSPFSTIWNVFLRLYWFHFCVIALLFVHISFKKALYLKYKVAWCLSVFPSVHLTLSTENKRNVNKILIIFPWTFREKTVEARGEAAS